jgi:hypothetical protein
MVILIVLNRRYGSRGYLDVVKTSTQGHSFMSMVVAFLLVSRVNTGLTRYNLARGAVEIMYRETSELVQGATILSSSGGNSNDSDRNCAAVTAAREWRHEVAYRALILLRSAMVVIDYPVDFVAPWDMPELNGVEADDIKRNIYLSSSNRRWAHGDRTIWEEGMRVPIRIAYLTRKCVHSQVKRLTEPINVIQLNRLFANVDNFMGGYYGIREFLTTVRKNIARGLAHSMHQVPCGKTARRLIRSWSSLYHYSPRCILSFFPPYYSPCPFHLFKWLARSYFSMCLRSPLSCCLTLAVIWRTALRSFCSPMGSLASKLWQLNLITRLAMTQTISTAGA